MAERARAPAYYAGGSDWWLLLHPPYTLWHLSYVAIGASLAPRLDATALVATLLAFFFAVGVSAHALDELHGRPLRTRISRRALTTAAIAGLVAALALGVAGIPRVGPGLVLFMAVGVVLVLGYNLELAGGRLHTDFVFAAAWGSFPVLTAYFAQTGRVDAIALLGAAAAFALSAAQRSLSTPARFLRRHVHGVDGRLILEDGSARAIDDTTMLQPMERALRALSWGVAALAAGLVLARLGSWS